MYLHVDGAVGDECEGGGSKEEKSELGDGEIFENKTNKDGDIAP